MSPLSEIFLGLRVPHQLNNPGTYAYLLTNLVEARAKVHFFEQKAQSLQFDNTRLFLHCSPHSNSGSTASYTNCSSSVVLHFHVLQFHVLHFHVLQFGPSISCPAFSFPEILMVRHFQVLHFQSTRRLHNFPAIL